jgi:hypothetical protein
MHLHPLIRCFGIWSDARDSRIIVATTTRTGVTVVSECHVETYVRAPDDQVVALLSARPHTWLRAFLSLASCDAAGHPRATAAGEQAWYRVGGPAPIAPDRVSLSFLWWPHLGVGLFTQFNGRFVVRPRPDGAILSIDGNAVGGTKTSNSAALRRLLELFAAAVSADHELGR